MTIPDKPSSRNQKYSYKFRFCCVVFSCLQFGSNTKIDRFPNISNTRQNSDKFDLEEIGYEVLYTGICYEQYGGG